MPKYGSEYARVLNMPDMVHSLRSLYKYLTLIERQACSEPCQTAKMEHCGRMNNCTL